MFPFLAKEETMSGGGTKAQLGPGQQKGGRSDTDAGRHHTPCSGTAHLALRLYSCHSPAQNVPVASQLTKAYLIWLLICLQPLSFLLFPPCSVPFTLGLKLLLGQTSHIPAQLMFPFTGTLFYHFLRSSLSAGLFSKVVSSELTHPIAQPPQVRWIAFRSFSSPLSSFIFFFFF